MKDKIIDFLKLFLLIFAMTSGIYYHLTFIWVALGLPVTWWAILLIAVTTTVAELAYIKWVSVTTEE